MIIPIYRAKKIASDEYVIGYLDIQKRWETKCLSCNSLDTDSYNEYYSEKCKCSSCGKDLDFNDDNWEHGYIGEIQYLIRNNGEHVEVNLSTLAIHFPDMIDSKRNKIFASLQENKKHGDIIHNIIAPNNFGKMVVYWNSYRNAVCYEEENYCTPLQYLLKDELKDYKVIGIQE